MDAAQSAIKEAAGFVDAARSAIQVKEDNGRTPTEGDYQDLKDAESKNTELTNALADAVTPWRAAVTKL